jgi:hypothetical protein
MMPVPHPDDVAAVREAFAESRKDELLSVEESAEYLQSLLRSDWSDDA